MLKDIYKRLCGAHIRTRILVKKALLLRYFWPTFQRDSQLLVLSYFLYQFHAHVHYQPTNPMVPIMSPWPFEQWGTDIVRHFLWAPKNYFYFVIAIRTANKSNYLQATQIWSTSSLSRTRGDQVEFELECVLKDIKFISSRTDLIIHIFF